MERGIRPSASGKPDLVENRHHGNRLKNGTKSKRGKTFTGCWTCRSRKVKCDLRRPNCQRCEKSGLECGGYDIKLRWSKPLQFDEFGVPISAAQGNAQENTNNAGNDEPQYQRRNIDFVRYDEEYEFYEDMDDELSTLHNPPLDKIADNRTWIIKKFGVFKGTDDALLNYGKSKGKRRKLEKPAERQEPVTASSDSQMAPPSVSTATPVIDHQEILDMSYPTSSNSHEWISKELRDDALLSASALQGFPIIDLPFDDNAAPLDEGIGGAIQEPNDFFSTSGDDAAISRALRLLFHRHPSLDVEKVTTPSHNDPSMEPIVPLGNQVDIDCTLLGSKMPRPAIEVTNSQLPDPRIFNVPGSQNPFLQLPTTGLQVHGLTRFLLNYYYKNVADLMTVVALNQNPWKKLYFPRALKAVGDLAGIGYTANSRNSLLNALLAVSCFNLQSKFVKNSPEMQFYLNLGIEFRKQASSFLKICLSNTVKQERYKDVLTAILSMNSIDVVWGTMADCQQHLKICENFVKARMKARPKISEKAKTLHRIFSFLKLIQDSTALDQVTDQEIYDDEGRDNNNEDGQEEFNFNALREPSPISGSEEGSFREFVKYDGKIQIGFVKDSNVTHNSSVSTPIFKNIASESYAYSDEKEVTVEDIMSTDALYGLPQSLILLFSDCVRLARHKEYYRLKNVAIPKYFISLCQRFEKRLFKWTSEWKCFREGSEEFINDTIEGLHHHTSSFYYGLFIYYHTMVKNLNDFSLQNYVEKVLTHLKQMSDLILYKKVRIVPLIWQGFIAGCASTKLETQEEFRKWAATLASSGMGSYWGARQIMFEVWRRKRNGETGDSWYSVYRDWEMNLMLS
ncbi:hypothetical protein ZYGR_0AZ02740 [Zygosaccharomyces rouxii]|uniref:Zn(2)-C6 fungal-type domain-containing protein n=1 Tax=Zygosaccharomyces rouxii TaxID=4956 RepID=A0A1Q3AKK3_ZYGRO|nr:hypothetical protein ZYGR_0AZ02740 [Zygosaccharomyces rouxii]